MKTLVVANWKCNPTTQVEAQLLFRAAANAAKRARRTEIVICPPFVYISGFKFQASGFKIGAQDCFWEQKGAFTGEVSPKMLKDVGCRYVIVGHSERRRYFGETDEMVNKKIKSCLGAGLKPILCVGETQEEKQKGEMTNVLRTQVEHGLRGVERRRARNIVIAYEPVWAIGTGNNCSPDHAASAGLFIRKLLAGRYSRLAANNIPILYGGSVTSQNAASYVKEAGLQGLLVGGASLDPGELTKIINKTLNSEL